MTMEVQRKVVTGIATVTTDMMRERSITFFGLTNLTILHKGTDTILIDGCTHSNVMTTFSPACNWSDVGESDTPFTSRDSELKAAFSTFDSVISVLTYQMLQSAIECGVIPAIFLIGVPGNAISLIVFYRQGLRDRMNLCLFSLTLADLVYIISLFLLVSHCFVGTSSSWFQQKWKWTVRKYILSFVFGSMHSSGFLTTVTAVERCVCVVIPLRAATILNTKAMGSVILVALVVINVLCGVYTIKHDVVTKKNSDTGEDSTVFVETGLYTNNIVLAIVEDIVLSATQFSNFVVVTLSTAITVLELKTVIAWRERASSNNREFHRQRALMKMLISVSCVYLLCASPMVVLGLARFLVKEFSGTGRYQDLFYVTHRTAYTVLMLNSSVHVVVYFAQSSRFRREVQSLCPCRKFVAPRVIALDSSLTTQ